MTRYQLTALEYVQVVDRTPACSACGQSTGARVVERTVHRQGATVDVDGAEEARLLSAGALAPVGQPKPVEPTPEPAAAVPASGGAEKPKRTAKVEVWREYAVATGVATEAEADELTKDELIELVG